MAGPNFTTHNVINPYDTFSKSMANTSNFFVNAANSLANDERLKQQQAMDQARLAIANRSLALNERTTEAALQRQAKEQADKEATKRTLTDYTKTAGKHIPALVLANDTALRDKLNSTAVNKFNQFTKAHAKEYGLNPDEKYNPEWDDDKKAAWSTSMDKLRQAFYAKASKATDKAYKDAVPVDKTKAKAVVFRDLVTKGLDPTKADTMATALTNGYTDFATLEANRTSANNKKVTQLTNLLKALPTSGKNASGGNNTYGVDLKKVFTRSALNADGGTFMKYIGTQNREVVSKTVDFLKSKGYSDKQITRALQSAVPGAIDGDGLDADKLNVLAYQSIQKIPNTKSSNDPYAGYRKALIQKIAALTSDTPSIQGTAKYKLVNTFDKALSKDLRLSKPEKVSKNKSTSTSTIKPKSITNRSVDTSSITKNTNSSSVSNTINTRNKQVITNNSQINDIYSGSAGQAVDNFLYNSKKRLKSMGKDAINSINVPFKSEPYEYGASKKFIDNQPDTIGGDVNIAIETAKRWYPDIVHSLKVKKDLLQHVYKQNLGKTILAVQAQNEMAAGVRNQISDFLNSLTTTKDTGRLTYNGYTPKEIESAKTTFMNGKRVPPDLYDAIIKYNKTKGSNTTPTNWAIGK